jgi:hypothetical protein
MKEFWSRRFYSLPYRGLRNDVDNLFHILCAHSHCSHISQNTHLYAKYVTVLVSASFLAISLGVKFFDSLLYTANRLL